MKKIVEILLSIFNNYLLKRALLKVITMNPVSNQTCHVHSYIASLRRIGVCCMLPIGSYSLTFNPKYDVLIPYKLEHQNLRISISYSNKEARNTDANVF